MSVSLRDVVDEDLPVFFVQQLDPDANWMAAFTVEDPANQEAFRARWAKIRGDDTITKQTILVEGQVAGNISSFTQFGEQEVCYWVGREYWGQGVATAALAALLALVPTRPLHARVAKDNRASRRVLEKCGFTISGEDHGFSHARGEDVEEYLLTLAPAPCAE